MKITFLGASHGIPEANRKCSSALVEIGENRYLIDCGTDVTEQFATRNIPITSVRAIFITHMHGDHTNGLIPYLSLCAWAYTKADPEIYLPGDVEKTARAIRDWNACNLSSEPRGYRYRGVAVGPLYDDGILKVTAFETKHINHSYAYLLEAEGKRVLFSGDLSHEGPSVDFPVSVLEKPLALAICESAHFDATEYLPIFEGCENLGSVCINHYSERHMISMIELKRSLTAIPVTFATDGMEIRI